MENTVKKYDKIVFIGRLEGPHFGHMHILREAAKLGKEVIILCGSRNRARSIKNPWRLDEREIMINLAIEECVPELVGRFKIIGISDYAYNDQHWVKQVGLVVARELYTGHKEGGAYISGFNVALIGHKKDSTSFYLDMFPQWKYVEVEAYGDMSASNIRSSYFSNTDSGEFELICRDSLPTSVMNYLLAWRMTDEFKRLYEEGKFIEEYKRTWHGYSTDDIEADRMAEIVNGIKVAAKYAEDKIPGFNLKADELSLIIERLSETKRVPYDPTFVTTDAVMIESGHILMIQRGGQPGNGQWALPGGFLDASKRETVRGAAKRELVEETKIDVPPAMLLDLFKKAKTCVFDSPDRDLRGRIVTHGFLIELPSRASGLSKVKGSDDAVHAQWIPLYEIEQMSEDGKIFSDHADIIINMTGRI